MSIAYEEGKNTGVGEGQPLFLCKMNRDSSTKKSLYYC